MLLALGMLAADARQNTDAETWWREALREGDEIALSGAFALSLAMRGGDATADHGHAH